MALNSRYGRNILSRRMREQGDRCCYCRRRFTAEGATRPTIEHRKPKRDGGADRVANLAAACFHCNQHRGRQTARDRAKAAQATRDTAGPDASP